MEELELKNAFAGAFAGKRVLVTGHTGFKGSWLCLWLESLGAKLAGLALEPNTEPSVFKQFGLAGRMDSRIGDVRDGALVQRVVADAQPEIVFHLAAQPLVRASYERPVETMETNVLGTAHVLQAVRGSKSVRVCQVITTDKCYENRELDYAYREDDRLGGRDPYSASKACAELVVSSYRHSFFLDGGASISSARAGNVIGGGDWAKDRLVPDCARALAQGKPVVVRNPKAVRPWQHVLEPLSGYLSLAARQLAQPRPFAQAWNFGPSPEDDRTALQIAEAAAGHWGRGRVAVKSEPGAPHEAGLLKLDSAKARKHIGWRPVWNVDTALERTIAWYRAASAPAFDAAAFSRRQIEDYALAAREAGLEWAGGARKKAAVAARR